MQETLAEFESMRRLKSDSGDVLEGVATFMLDELHASLIPQMGKQFVRQEEFKRHTDVSDRRFKSFSDLNEEQARMFAKIQ